MDRPRGRVRCPIGESGGVVLVHVVVLVALINWGIIVFKDKLVPLTPCPVHPSLHHHVRRCNDILDDARGTTS